MIGFLGKKFHSEAGVLGYVTPGGRYGRKGGNFVKSVGWEKFGYGKHITGIADSIKAISAPLFCRLSLLKRAVTLLVPASMKWSAFHKWSTLAQRRLYTAHGFDLGGHSIKKFYSKGGPDWQKNQLIQNVQTKWRCGQRAVTEAVLKGLVLEIWLRKWKKRRISFKRA